MTQEVHYVPGGHTALVGPGCAILLADGGPEGTSSRLWPLVSAGAGLDELLDALAAGGLRSMGSFALVHGTRVVVRGVIEAQVGIDGRHLVARDVATWVEHAVEAGESIRLGAASEPGVALLPLVSGVVRAESLVFGAESTWAVRATPLELTPALAPAVTGVTPLLGSHGATTSESSPGEAQVGHGALPVSELTEIPDFTVAPSVEQRVSPKPPALVDAVPGQPQDDGEDEAYDHLFGATVSRSIEEAAVRPRDEDEESPATHSVPIVRDTDHDGSTILAHDLAAIRASAGSGVVGPAGQRLVQGVRCIADHANPPNNATCWRCGAPVPDQEARALPRPALGRLRVSDGAVIALDRTVFVGRTPTAGRFSKDGPPHLLRVDSPHQDISRTHVEVRIDDWDVLLLDLSTNGTRLVRPGQEPLLLHRGEPVPVLPGCVIELGDGVTLTYEAEPA